MAEAKHSGSKNFGKVLQKTVSRTKEKVLQNLGKADKTQDEEFDIHVNNFGKQQLCAVKLQKELKNYLQCVKAMSLASKVFYDTIRDLYEDEWTGHSEMTGAVEALTAMWEDYLLKLTNQVQEPITAYVGRFPDMKHKISKRNRKLMDFDGTRHTRDTLENQKKKDEAKINRAHDEMNAAKKIYNDINAELHEDLPNFYDSRKAVISNSLNSLFSSEAKFQEESAKIKNTLADATERLNRECSDVFFKQYSHSPHVSSERGSTTSTPPGGIKYPRHIPNDTTSNHSNTKRSNSNRSNRSNASNRSDSEKIRLGSFSGPEVTINSSKPTKLDTSYELTNHTRTNGDIGTDTTDTSPGPSSPDGEKENIETMYENIMLQSQTTQNTLVEEDDTIEAAATPPTVVKLAEVTNNNESKVDDSEDELTAKSAVKSPDPVYSFAKDTDESEDIYKVPTSNEPVEGAEDGPVVLFMVEATHPYTGEDMDELTFEIGDKINVINYDDPEEQDDGWLMGIKISNGEKGVFPENFTKRL